MIKTPSMQQLLEAGVHFGHQVRRGHPHMREYIYGVRDGVHIINLEESEKKLKEAAEFAYKLGTEGKVLLFVGTKKQAQPIVYEWATKIGAPYLNYRWMGGFLTNFDEIKRNIRKLTGLEEQKTKGELSRYTKKEQLLITRKLEKFATELGGVAHLEKLPDALFIIDCVGEKTALVEANRMKIPVVAITDSNADPALVDYPVPGNDDATKAIQVVVETVGGAYESGVKKAGGVKMKAEKMVKREEAEELTSVADEVADAEQKVEKEIVKESERVV